jgi:hypothetical protein
MRFPAFAGVLLDQSSWRAVWVFRLLHCSKALVPESNPPHQQPRAPRRCFSNSVPRAAALLIFSWCKISSLRLLCQLLSYFPLCSCIFYFSISFTNFISSSRFQVFISLHWCLSVISLLYVELHPYSKNEKKKLSFVPAPHHPIHSYPKIPCHYQSVYPLPFIWKHLYLRPLHTSKKGHSHKLRQFHGKLGTLWLKVGSIASYQ